MRRRADLLERAGERGGWQAWAAAAAVAADQAHKAVLLRRAALADDRHGTVAPAAATP